VAHLDAISATLDGGTSCLWLVPDALVASGTADEFLHQLADRPDSTRVPPPKNATTRRTPAMGLSVSTESALDQRRPSWARDVFGLLQPDDWTAPEHVIADVMADPTDLALAERLATALEEDLELDDDPVPKLVAAPRLRGRTIVISGWDELDPPSVGGLLVRLPAVVKELGIPPTERPRLLVAARLTDLPDVVFDRIDPVTTRVMWWWGATGRLDTSVVVATARARKLRDQSAAGWHPVLELVAAEVIAEVAGPDMALAERLATCWDGRMDSLEATVVGGRSEAREIVRAAKSGHGGGGVPPVSLRPAWTGGLVDLWDGQIRPVWTTIAVTDQVLDLRVRIWRGQNRALGPFIDEHRAQLEKKVRSRASMATLGELTQGSRSDQSGRTRDGGVPGGTALELGTMAWAVASRRVRLSPDDTDLLFCLKDARNALAHLAPLSDSDLERMVRLLPNEA
jgi:hypothetical protein